MADKFQAVVIGGGPGGYVCAIRLAQLGMKTACIESRGSLGGTCLNVGCIPSKSLLNLSEEFHKVKNLSSKGIEVGEVKLNLDKMMKSKEKAVTVLTKGVEFLLKKNNVTYFKGVGSFKSKNEISIEDVNKNETSIFAEKIIIATGSVPSSLPGIDFDEKIISYEKILKIFFQIHDPTTLNSQGPDIGTQYRSEIFYLNDNQKKTAKKVLQEINQRLSGKVVTKISLLKNYCPAEEYHQKYLEKK